MGRIPEQVFAGMGGGGVREPVVLTVAFPYAVIGPRAVGGAEVICTQLEAAVAGTGMRSVVVAREGSEPRGRLYATRVPEGEITEEARREVQAAVQTNLDRALRENAVAVVHMHGLDFWRYRLPEGMPVVVTLHLPPGWYPETIWGLPGNYVLVCVSESQRRACPAEAQGRVEVIGNGVEMDGEVDGSGGGSYALMMSRICPEKNLHVGLEAARWAGVPAILAGEVYPYASHLTYFAEEIEPRLAAVGGEHERRAADGGERVGARFVGAVAGRAKRRLLRRARCLLLPSLAPETSSLVAMEALAAGVPVVAMAVGAVPEIVEEGRTGFLVQPGEGAAEAMAVAIGRVGELDREVCRAEAGRRFPLSGMLEGYGALYRRLLARVRGEMEAVGELVAEEVTEADAWEGLVPAWERLFVADVGATPFQHPAWLVPWWRQFGMDGELQAVAVRARASGELVGLLPVYVLREGRVLLMVGAGTTDVLDGVWAGEAVAAKALAGAVEGLGWGRASLGQLRGGSPLLRAGREAGLRVVGAASCSRIEVGRELPARIRANVGRYRRRAKQVGEVVCRVAETAAEALAGFEELVRLHGERWTGRGEAGVLRDERVLAHHRESVPLLLEAGLLRMFSLRIGGKVVGVLYALADAPHVVERRLSLYLIGIDVGVGECSPGTLLLHEVWLYARANGFALLDLLRGGEAYKGLWGARTEAMFGVEVGR